MFSDTLALSNIKKFLFLLKFYPLFLKKIGSDMVLDDAESKDTYNVTKSTFNQVLVAK